MAALAGAIVVFLRYVREPTKLNRRLQLTALSIGFGAGLISSLHEHLPLLPGWLALGWMQRNEEL